jgi:hypothetical protein
MADVATEEAQTDPRYLFRQPRALQWFENGKLFKRSEEERQASKAAPSALNTQPVD